MLSAHAAPERFTAVSRMVQSPKWASVVQNPEKARFSVLFRSQVGQRAGSHEWKGPKLGIRAALTMPLPAHTGAKMGAASPKNFRPAPPLEFDQFLKIFNTLEPLQQHKGDGGGWHEEVLRPHRGPLGEKGQDRRGGRRAGERPRKRRLLHENAKKGRAAAAGAAWIG